MSQILATRPFFYVFNPGGGLPQIGGTLFGGTTVTDLQATQIQAAYDDLDNPGFSIVNLGAGPDDVPGTPPPVEGAGQLWSEASDRFEPTDVPLERIFRKEWHSNDDKRSLALRRFHSKLFSGTVNILAGPSDSIGDGLGASGFNKKWTSVLRDRLRLNLGMPAGGMGYFDFWNQAAHPDHPVVTHLPVPNTTWGLGRQSLDLINNPGDPQTITISGVFTDLDLMLLVTTGGITGNIQLSVDGGAAVVYNTGAAGVSSGGYRLVLPALQGLSNAAHTVLIAYQSGPTSTLEGAFAFRGDKVAGVRMWEAGQSGMTAAFFDPVTSPYWWQSLAAVSPDLAIVPIGSNDFATGSTVATAKAHIESIVDTIPTAGGHADTSIVLMAYYDRAHSSVDPWPKWVKMYHEIAATRDNVAVFDLGPIFGPWVGDNRGGLTDPADKVHPSDFGHARIANSLLDWLTAGVM